MFRLKTVDTHTILATNIAIAMRERDAIETLDNERQSNNIDLMHTKKGSEEPEKDQR